MRLLMHECQLEFINGEIDWLIHRSTTTGKIERTELHTSEVNGSMICFLPYGEFK